MAKTQKTPKKVIKGPTQRVSKERILGDADRTKLRRIIEQEGGANNLAKAATLEDIKVDASTIRWALEGLFTAKDEIDAVKALLDLYL
jgi:hypothetical protein